MKITVRFGDKTKEPFKPGERITLPLDAGILPIIGDNGCGKSMLLRAVCCDSIKKDARVNRTPVDFEVTPEGFGAERFQVAYFDFELMLQRAAGTFQTDHIGIEMQLRWLSHGQAVQAVQQGFRSAKNPTLFVLDEPEAGLSLKAQKALLDALDACVKKGHRVLLATHSVVLMAARPLAFDLERRCMVDVDRYVGEALGVQVPR